MIVEGMHIVKQAGLGVRLGRAGCKRVLRLHYINLVFFIQIISEDQNGKWKFLSMDLMYQHLNPRPEGSMSIVHTTNLSSCCKGVVQQLE